MKVIFVALFQRSHFKYFVFKGKVFKKLYGSDYDADKQFSSLIGLIKIDFPAFLDFHEKYKLRRLLSNEEPDSEAIKTLFNAMDIDGDGVMSEFEFKQMMKKVLEVSGIPFHLETFYVVQLLQE